MQELAKIKIDDPFDEACALIYPDGSCKMYNEFGNLIENLSRCGLSGLWEFDKLYPGASWYWSVWDQWHFKVSPDKENFLKYIKTNDK